MKSVKESLIHIRDTIKAQATRIGELEATSARQMTVIHQANEELHELRDELEVRTNQANEFQKRMNEYRETASDARYQSNMDVDDDDSTAEFCIITGEYKIEDRMANVCRLASAAIRHCRRGNNSIAEQLLIPLAGGQHDVYRHDEAADYLSEARPDDHTRTVKSIGSTPYIFD